VLKIWGKEAPTVSDVEKGTGEDGKDGVPDRIGYPGLMMMMMCASGRKQRKKQGSWFD